jgi:glycosyltransferase involved in cell wall biosynthesis
VPINRLFPMCGASQQGYIIIKYKVPNLLSWRNTMKIVLTVEQFDPNKGYLEYYLARELTKLGHKVCVFTFGWSKSVLRTMLEEGFEVVSVPHIVVVNKYHMPSLRGVAYITNFVKKEKPDIVHCQPLFSPLSLLFISCSRLSRHQIVGSLITGEYSINSIMRTRANLKYNFIKTIIERYLKNKVYSFFAISDEWKALLIHLFNIPHQKIVVIPLGADPQLFEFDEKARNKTRNLLGLYAEDVVVAYSGKIIQTKQLHVLVEAIAPIIRQNRNVKLLIVGKGEPSYIKYLKELCLNFKISNNVIFHPWVHRTRLRDVYSASDIAVWPGGPSISIVEAASVGLPVIIKRSPITKYTLQHHNGFTFEQGNISELRKYLRILIRNEKMRKDMGRKSRLLVEQKLNWRAITLQHLDTYTRIQ